MESAWDYHGIVFAAVYGSIAGVVAMRKYLQSRCLSPALLIDRLVRRLRSWRLNRRRVASVASSVGDGLYGVVVDIAGRSFITATSRPIEWCQSYVAEWNAQSGSSVARVIYCHDGGVPQKTEHKTEHSTPKNRRF